MTEQEELEQLKKLTPYSLPDNTGESGWSTAQNKKKFYEGFFYIYGLFKDLRNDYTTKREEILALMEVIQTSYDNLISGVTAVPKANADKDGNEFSATYAKVANLMNGTVAVLKYIKQDGTYANVRDIVTQLENHIAVYNAFITTNFVNGKAKTAQLADKATSDADGNPIKSTYATKTELNSTNSEVTKIKNGTTIVAKANADKSGNEIESTYEKKSHAESTYLPKSDVENSLDSTSTTKALSAYQGKVIKGMIDAINTLLQSNDVNLDTLQEIVTYIKNNKSLIEGITTSKMGFADLVTNYTSDLTNKPLAASVAVLLKNLIDGKLAPADIVNALDSELTNKPLSAKQGKVLKGLIDALDNAKADADSVYTKEETDNQIHNAVAGVETMNVIDDEDNDIEYDFQIKVRNGKPVLILNEIE